MKKFLVAIVVFFIIQPTLLNANGTNDTVDGRFNTGCMPPPGQKIGLCIISFYKLISNPEYYDGKMVEITGFVVSAFGSYVIFPSADSYRANIDSEGIELQGHLNFGEGFAGNIKSGLTIRLSGVFDAHYQGGGIVRLGALKKVRIYNYRFIRED